MITLNFGNKRKIVKLDNKIVETLYITDENISFKEISGTFEIVLQPISGALFSCLD